MDIKSIQEEIIDEFQFMTDWEDKYNYIIELARDLAPFPAHYRDEDHKVRGCQSQVWLHAEAVDAKIRLYADSDALIPKGLISLLLRVYSDQPAAAIATEELYFIERIGLSSNLSPTRSNGLASMVQKIKSVAVEHLAQR
jgi:cysteine desulfuration protein SufE